ncbi:glycosyltransferase family 2 protein [Candidatus Methylopumilus universalis]|uniref:glycosyltransferase family 2 protein n=1 Tax=Candidatus Methylopumilus universalis TaxID=2588536 RepID=UPI003BEEF524
MTNQRNKPLVSIIIPTFNRGYCIKKTINSVLDQSYRNIEVLVCDDGSIDNTRKVVSSIKDNRVKWISGEHTGTPSAPRNAGLKNSKGDWIAFIDSDDLWDKNKLSIQLNYLESNPKFLACSTNALINRNNECYLNLSKDISILDTKILLANNYIITSSLIAHKSLFKKSFGFNEHKNIVGAEDYEKWLKLSLFTDINLLSAPLVFYTTNSSDSIRNSCKNTLMIPRAQLNLLKFLLFINPLKCLYLSLYLMRIYLLKIYFFSRHKMNRIRTNFKSG